MRPVSYYRAETHTNWHLLEAARPGISPGVWALANGTQRPFVFGLIAGSALSLVAQVIVSQVSGYQSTNAVAQSLAACAAATALAYFLVHHRNNHLARHLVQISRDDEVSLAFGEFVELAQTYSAARSIFRKQIKERQQWRASLTYLALTLIDDAKAIEEVHAALDEIDIIAGVSDDADLAKQAELSRLLDELINQVTWIRTQINEILTSLQSTIDGIASEV